MVATLKTTRTPIIRSGVHQSINLDGPDFRDEHGGRGPDLIDSIIADEKHVFGTQTMPTAGQFLSGVIEKVASAGFGNPDRRIYAEIAANNALSKRRAKVLTYMEKNGVKVPPRMLVAGFGGGKAVASIIRPVGVPEVELPIIIPPARQLAEPRISSWTQAEIVAYVTGIGEDSYAGYLTSGGHSIPVLDDALTEVFRRRDSGEVVDPYEGVEVPGTQEPIDDTGLRFRPGGDPPDDDPDDPYGGETGEDDPLLDVPLDEESQVRARGRPLTTNQRRLLAAAIAAAGAGVTAATTTAIETGTDLEPVPNPGHTHPLPKPVAPGPIPVDLPPSEIPTFGEPEKPVIQPEKTPVIPPKDPPTPATPTPATTIPIVPGVTETPIVVEPPEAERMNPKKMPKLRPQLNTAGSDSIELLRETDNENERVIMEQFVIKNTDYIGRMSALRMEEQRNEAIRFHDVGVKNSMYEGDVETMSVMSCWAYPSDKVKKVIKKRGLQFNAAPGGRDYEKSLIAPLGEAQHGVMRHSYVPPAIQGAFGFKSIYSMNTEPLVADPEPTY
jgi:hypothetical protein